MNYREVYGSMHARNPTWFSGYSIKASIGEIADLVFEFQPDRLLDYGSGKGYQYLEQRLHRHWGGLLPHCYDPGVRQLRKKPEGTFGGIICTDVMEHIEEADVEETLGRIFGHAALTAFVFFYIACRPTHCKRLPDGRDVHVTVRPPEWWGRQMDPFRRDGLTIRVVYDEG